MTIIDTLELEHREARAEQLSRWWVLAATLLAMLAATVWWRGQSRGAQAFVTARVERVEVPSTITASGALRAQSTVDVGAEISGLVRTVHVDYNEGVSKGQVLAELDTAQLAAAVQEAVASVSAAQAALELAQVSVDERGTTLARLIGLEGQGLAPTQDLDAAQAGAQRARAEHKAAHARLHVAQASLLRARTDLEHAFIRSPIDGVVLKRSIEPGQTVAATLQAPVLFTLAQDLRKMVLHVNVDEADVGRVREGQSATFHVDAHPDRDFTASVLSVHNAAETVHNVVTYEAVLAVDNEDRALRPGMTAVASVVTEKAREVLRVPTSALRFTPPGWPPSSQPKDQGERARVFVLRDGRVTELIVSVRGVDGPYSLVAGPELRAGLETLIAVQRKER